VLPAKTEQVWDFLKTQPTLAGFVLIGGSALALRLRHRISEDLDFTFIGSKLPANRLSSLQQQAEHCGLKMSADDDPAAVEEFAGGGLELRDYQQDYIMNGLVKVSFFLADQALSKVLTEPATAAPRLATLNELFKAKCLVSAVRSKTRDWLDIYLLLRNHGFSLKDYRNAFCEAGIESQFDVGITRLCSGKPERNDEGYVHLLGNAPSIEEMAEYFRSERDRFEVERAAEARRARGRSIE